MLMFNVAIKKLKRIYIKSYHIQNLMDDQYFYFILIYFFMMKMTSKRNVGRITNAKRSILNRSVTFSTAEKAFAFRNFVIRTKNVRQLAT
jgi:hypothetical protein